MIMGIVYLCVALFCLFFSHSIMCVRVWMCIWQTLVLVDEAVVVAVAITIVIAVRASQPASQPATSCAALPYSQSVSQPTTTTTQHNTI